MITPARARLGRRRSGLALGYRVLDLTRQPVTGQVFTGITEAQPGDYVTVVDAPAAGGFIVWGTRENPAMVEALLPPSPAAPDLAPIREAIGKLARLIESIPAPVVTVDTAPFVEGLHRTRQDVTGLMSAEQARRATDADALRAELATIAQQVIGLQRLNESAHQFAHLDAAASRFAAMTQLGERLTNAGLGIIDLMALAKEFAQLRVDITQLHEATTTAIEAAQRDAAERLRTVEVIDNLLSIVGQS